MPRVSANSGSEPPMVGERRQLTILFCDLVNYTPLSEVLDGEELASLIIDYQEAGQRIFQRYGGYIAQFLGDGLLVYFGYPEAHENDAERSVHSALELLSDLDRISQTFWARNGVRLTARVGVHTGPAVVGQSARTERSVVFGETINIASRIQAAAEPGTIFISQSTLSLLRGQFITQEKGTPPLKGVSRPIKLHRIIGPSLAGNTTRDWKEPNTLVGRAPERAVLNAEWERTRKGERRAVAISGEPGVGKSRLLRSLRSAVSHEPHTWLEAQCAALSQGTTLYPVITLIKRTLGIADDLPQTDKLAKLQRALKANSLEPNDSVPVLAALLGLHPDGRHPVSHESPEILRQRTLETLVAWIEHIAQPQPLILVCEDLHWSDSTTLELLSLLLHREGTLRLLCIVTHRPEFELRGPPAIERIKLKGLAREEAFELARLASAKGSLDQETLDGIVQRASGNPLFIEELAKMALETGTSESKDHAMVPPTLDALLMARLDGLGTSSKYVAQLAATLGREFEQSLLASVAGTEPEILQQAIHQLLRVDILQSGSTSDRIYSFRHVLIQDAAYHSLLKSERREIHARVARVLREEFAQRVATEPELVAHHLLCAGVLMEAAEWFGRAGRQAAEQAAVEEATRHYQRGLEALESAGPGTSRDQLEMSLQILLGNALMGVRGFGSPETMPVWQRAVALAEKLGDTNETTSALNGLAAYYFGRGNCHTAVDYGQRILALADPLENRIGRLRAHTTIAAGLMQIGDGQKALWHAERAIEAYRPTDFRLVTYGVGTDQGVIAYGTAASASWWLGRPDVALAQVRAGVELAERIESALSLAAVKTYLALIHHYRREADSAFQIADENVTFCERLRFPFWRGVSLLIRGGQDLISADRRLEDVMNALEALARTGSQTGATLGLAILAEAQRANGDSERALATADRALQVAGLLRQHFWDSELFRIKGELLAARDTHPAAEETLRAALHDASSRGAQSLELRAAIALARVLTAAHRREEGVAIVSEVYGRFTEGFDTCDLRDAAVLLR
jgi:class 3 adenylate cyclase/tetratricopeptide (TPR) repeat protein